MSIVAAGTACRTDRGAVEPVGEPEALGPPPAVASTPAREIVVASLEGGPTALTGPGEALLLTRARVIDGTGVPPRATEVLIADGRIAAIGPGLTAPAGCRVVDLGGRTITPGFIDAHVHLGSGPSDSHAASVERHVTMSEGDRALMGVANAAATLRAGFTTVRNVGGSLADRALRDAIARGWVAGPRILVANHSIGITGGHCDGGNGLHPDLQFPAEASSGVVDGPEAVRAAVRWQIKYGADVIKVCSTGGVLSQGDAVGATQMTSAELVAAVEEAHKAERKVAAHAHGREGIALAVRAGVDSIEHGSQIDAAIAAEMKRRGTWLVPTSYVGVWVERMADEGRFSPESAAKAKAIAPEMRASLRLAHQKGVRIANGSDAGVFPHGENGRELLTLIELGLSPLEAITAATGSASVLLGLADVGTLRPGYVADLLVFDGDPLADPKLLVSPAIVIQSGVVQVDRLRLAPPPAPAG